MLSPQPNNPDASPRLAEANFDVDAFMNEQVHRLTFATEWLLKVYTNIDSS